MSKGNKSTAKTRALVDELVHVFTSSEDMPGSDNHSLPETLHAAAMDARRTMHKVNNVADNIMDPIEEIKDILHDVKDQLAPTVERAANSFRETSIEMTKILKTVNVFSKPVLILMVIVLLLSMAALFIYLYKQFREWASSSESTTLHSSPLYYQRRQQQPAEGNNEPLLPSVVYSSAIDTSNEGSSIN
jgi:hypothetical protein